MTLEHARDALRAAGVNGRWVIPGQAETLGAEKGAYALVLHLEEPVGFNQTSLRPGLYVYLGSARGPGGLGARLKRHFQAEKKIHWHIDRLTTATGKIAASAIVGGDECDLVAKLLRQPKFECAATGFGSTDCRVCQSHLLRATILASN